jgi:hypothetical protein
MEPSPATTPVCQPNGEWLRLEIALPGYSVWLRAWQVQVGRVKLYPLDSNDAGEVKGLPAGAAQRDDPCGGVSLQALANVSQEEGRSWKHLATESTFNPRKIS